MCDPILWDVPDGELSSVGGAARPREQLSSLAMSDRSYEVGASGSLASRVGLRATVLISMR